MNFKKIFSSVFIALVSLFFLIAGFLRSNVSEVKAAPTLAPEGSVVVIGYAWSDTIGWINFDPSYGGVFYNLTTKILSGYAWSDNIGWIKFDGLSSYPDSLRGSVATADDGGFLSGWARACAGTDKGDCSTMVSRPDGWDGWVSLSRRPSGTGIDYGVKIDLVSTSQTYGDFSGYAWGSDVVGWIKFNCQDTPGECAQSDYKVRAILPGVSLDVSCVAEPDGVFLNERVVFTANATGGTAPYFYKWTGDDNLSGTSETAEKAYPTAGIKTATVEVKDSSGTTVTSSCSMEVREKSIEDPSYNISPNLASAHIKGTQQFTGIYDSDKTGTSEDVSDVTNLAVWTSSNENIATITTSGSSGRGLATCDKVSDTGDIVITSSYTNTDKKTFTDTALLSCLPIDPPNRTLTVNIIGKGEVDGLIGNCNQTNSPCSKYLDNNESGYLRASPDAGYTFNLSGWSGSCSQSIGNVFKSNGTDDYSEGDYVCDPLTMTANKTVTVVFEKDPTYEISPKVTKIKIGEKMQFTGLWSDGEHYQQDKTDVAEWKTVDELGIDDDLIATFKSAGSKKGEAKCVSVGTAYVYSSYGGKEDTAKLTCGTDTTIYFTLTVNKVGDGDGEITGGVICDVDCASVSKDYPKGTVVEITASNLEGSSFNGWAGACDSFVKTPKCVLTILEDKTATASFTENPLLLPIAYISADDIKVDNGGNTTIRWKSDNAVSCVGDGGDVNWTTGDLASGFKTTMSFGPYEERNYAITCYDAFKNENSASVVVTAGGVDIPPPTVDLFAEPDDVDVGGTAELSWLSSNTESGSCSIASDDDNNFGINGKKVVDNSSVQTGALATELHKYSYTITCVGDDKSSVEDEVVVETKAKPCLVYCVETGKITITASDITATIVAGLTTNSDKSDTTVSSKNCKESKATLSFEYVSGSGPGIAYLEKINKEIVALPTEETVGNFGKFFIKNIKGITEAGTYPIILTATCIDSGSKTGEEIRATKTINFIVKKISSNWQEI